MASSSPGAGGVQATDAGSRPAPGFRWAASQSSPAPVRQPLRVTGPGRLERRYQRRIEGLERGLEDEREQVTALVRELDTARLVERGSQRLLDRVEGELERRAEALGQVRRQGHRLMVTLGALQRENQGLRERLALAEQRLAGLEQPERRGFWQRLLGR